MNRRELLKSSLLICGAAVAGNALGSWQWESHPLRFDALAGLRNQHTGDDDL